jgi:CBS domain-containing protein
MDPKHPSIYSDEAATKARALIRDLNLRILPVTDGEKRLLGKVSRRDMLTISSSVSPIQVKGIMTPAKHIAKVDDDVASTVRIMLKVDVWCAPVVTSEKEKTYRGVLGLESYIRNIVENSPEKFRREVSEIMTKKVVTCSPDDEVDRIWRLMQETRLTGLPVVKNGKLVGIVTAKDLLKKGAALPGFEAVKGRFKSSPKVSSIMKTGVVAVEPTVKAIRVAKALVEKDIGRIPVRDRDGKLLGIVDRADIILLTMK